MLVFMKANLEKYILFLHELKLESKDSRVRSRFKKVLVEHYQQFQEEMHELKEQHMLKNEDGSFVMRNRAMVPRDVHKLQHELQELLEEKVLIEATGERLPTLQGINQILQQCTLQLEGETADVYDELCEQFEQYTE
ncbi:hypothetical protein SAMN05720606_10879 [Paenibacillus polysaccharolyticus]|uniref:Uncharacterized protein n=1 Tax=Paenibacillus polysaccharolyticus TaxID=582692 RepID=A0A1G5I6V7_9BACL|nr:hypothetical protein [Paenibacillus polysaccharolyticus]MDP9698883.1 hypothetical protein [Paenibacillus intestini]SCY71856.1 hypothetical protein SAMN05720606_10879 [Paenibacillus polysaccharolyticus]